MATEADYADFRNGLRILARMIVRAHLKDLARIREMEKEENHANQGSKRGGEVAPAGENQVGDQKRE